MHFSISFFALPLAVVVAQSSSSIGDPSSTLSSSTVAASVAASSGSSSSSGTCSSSNIQIDPCLTATTWTLDLPSTEELVRDSEAKSGQTINSLSITGLGTLAMSQTIPNPVYAHYAYQNFAVNMEIEAEGTDTPTKTVINGEFDATVLMTTGGGGSGTFCMHITSGSGTAHIDAGSFDFDEPLTPDGGFIQDDYVFSYTCSSTKLTMQGTFNGNTVVGPYVFNGNGTSTSTGNGTSPITCRADSCGPFNWEPLVQKACDEYSQAKSVAPNTRGYFGQVLNLVCAAAKSTNACCSEMAPYYNKDGCSDYWAGAFDEFVFNSFLGPDSPDFNTILEQLLSAEGTVSEAAEGDPWWNFFKSKDFGALYAGAEHFIDNLAGPFNDFIGRMVSKNLATCDFLGLERDLASLATEHNALFRCAVLPGFTVQRNRGDISLLPSVIAQASVPVAAWTMRTVLEVAHEIAGRLHCVRLLGARDEGGNGTEPSTTNLQAVANSLDLTIPGEPAFAGDYRTWVPNSQPLSSSADLTATTRQILSNGSDVTIEVALSDSSACVKVSADRSQFDGEAVVALSLAFPSANSSTPWVYGNTNVSLFGPITMIVPSTFPVGIVNEYLFVNNTNTTLAEHLNETSMVDNGYNILFNAFDLSMTYECLPAGVSASSLHLVDLINGAAVPSTVDPTTKSINAVGVHGYGQAWGGGGVYAIGYH